MKILHTADWHIGSFKGPTQDGINLRSLDTLKCLDAMCSMAEDARPDLVLVSGDIFHTAEIGQARSHKEVLQARGFIQRLAKAATYVVVMRGTPNHDSEDAFKELEAHFENVRNVSVITVPKVLNTPLANIVCIPGFDKQDFRARFPGLSSEDENLVWTNEISSLVQGMKAFCEPGKPNILMSHFTVPGCNMESGQTSVYANFEPVIPREALEAADYDLVALGHIHRPQQIHNLRNVFYSGAINTITFNDEGQPRGFWIHDTEDGKTYNSVFYPTPFRQFQTIDWNEEDVGEYLLHGAGWLEGWMSENGIDVSEKIVRIRYSCTTDQKKALNIPKLQGDLESMGAFYVADIEAQAMIDITNRGLLAQEADPLPNLQKWLEEKCVRDIPGVMELAAPIVSTALAQENTADVHGVFRPVSISVKNYRNYKEQSFDFSDISFCTINGENGAGKSSLFMDAIVDCLFEETREGDSKAWLRATPDTRSGSIEFIFDIGEKRFRVVRTRAKSGKGTVNLSAWDGEEWINLSKEKMRDTQDEIERVIGMDCMTFRSCALIMQDQYGLFLQAKKDERMGILSKLLGLGTYETMEQEARNQLRVYRSKLASTKDEINIKAGQIAEKGDPEHNIRMLEQFIAENQAKKESLQSDIEAVQKEFQTLQAAYAEYRENVDLYEKLGFEGKTLSGKLAQTRNEADQIILSLASAGADKAKETEYWKADGMIRKLDPVKAQLDALMGSDASSSALGRKAAQLEAEILSLTSENYLLQAQLDEFKTLDSELSRAEEGCRELDSLRSREREINEVLAKKADYQVSAEMTLSRANRKLLEIRHTYDKTKDSLTACEEQEKFMQASGCIDLPNARCRFLAKAKADAGKIPEIRENLKAVSEKMSEQESYISQLREDYHAKMEAFEKETADHEDVQKRIRQLISFPDMKNSLQAKKASESDLKARLSSNNKIIASKADEASQVKCRASEARQREAELASQLEHYDRLKEIRDRYDSYKDASSRIAWDEATLKGLNEKMELQKQLVAQNAQQQEQVRTKIESASKPHWEAIVDAQNKVFKIKDDIKAVEKSIAMEQADKGRYEQMLDDVRSLQADIEVLSASVQEIAHTCDNYDILKTAFSQDGVPHQIVRNIVPVIEDTANNILGSMTGGTMGVEFVMEKAVKGRDGDKPTLDVLINEYGKTTLPYASKSGGEKVKASLAVILALAEIKTGSAGIRLGMLFIDEPPFLDADGTQAYVDSLEVIRSRYPDVKVMAITHDTKMKARFTQSVDVIKTDEGSKVIG